MTGDAASGLAAQSATRCGGDQVGGNAHIVEWVTTSGVTGIHLSARSSGFTVSATFVTFHGALPNPRPR